MELACICGNKSYQRYVIPDLPIHPKATEVTGLYVAGGQLFQKQSPVVSASLKKCVAEFVEWLKTFHNPLPVCHNGRSFDSVILVKTFSKFREFALEACICGFVDTLSVFREHLPGRTTYKLESLVKHTMKVSYNAHSAIEDVAILQSLVKYHKLSDETLLKHSFDVIFVKKSIDFKCKENECFISLHPLEKCVSNYMLRKIAHSGLKYEHWKLPFERGGAEGIETILGENNDSGKVRVTKTKSVIGKIVDHFNASV